MEPYLRQWFIHENGGVEPVRLRRGTPESNIFQAFISKKPEDWSSVPEEGCVAIIVPQYKGLDPEYWCYLPPRAKQTLYNCIKSSFDVQLFKELNGVMERRVLLRDIIDSYMEKHGIEDTETNWNALAKIFMWYFKGFLSFMSAVSNMSVLSAHNPSNNLSILTTQKHSS